MRLLVLSLCCGSVLFADTVYVADTSSSEVYWIDTATNIATVITQPTPPFATPSALAAMANGTAVYVADGGLSGEAGEVYCINATTYAAAPVSTSTPFVEPFCIAIAAPYGRNETVYVGDVGNGKVYWIDTSTNIAIPVAAPTPNFVNPRCMVATPDGSAVYVGDIDSGRVYWIDTTTHMATPVTGAIPTPVALIVTEDGATVYVADEGASGSSGQVHWIATNANVANTVAEPTPNFVEPISLGLFYDGMTSTVYVGDDGSNHVYWINTTTHVATAVTQPSPAFIHPVAFVATPQGSAVNAVYVADSNLSGEDGQVYSIDPTTHIATAITDPTPNFVDPLCLAITGDGTTFYVGDSGSHKVYAVVTSTNTATPIAAPTPNFVDPAAFAVISPTSSPSTPRSFGRPCNSRLRSRS